jgi:putative acetyltransferase
MNHERRMVIRPETSSDQPAIFDVIARAFGREAEARLVDALRTSTAFIPELSLVACLAEARGRGGRAEAGPGASEKMLADGPSAREDMLADVVGHILFTRMAIKGSDASHDALALAPLAVLPAHQRSGIGAALVRYGLAASAGLGHHIVIVLGHPEYYPKFGFVPASRFGIRPPFDVRPEAFMALELQPGALLHVQGEAEYAAPFMTV